MTPSKSCEGKSKPTAFIQRAPLSWKGVCKAQAEHGPGAMQAIGSLCRVRPLKRRSVLALPEAAGCEAGANQGGNTVFMPSLYFLRYKDGFFYWE